MDTALPLDMGLQLTDAEWVCHQQLKAGAVKFPPTGTSLEVTARHDRVVQCLAAQLKRGGFAVRTELRVDPASDHRMDIVLGREGSELWLDVSVVHPLRGRYARKAAEKGGAAAEARENEKRNSWKALAEKHKKEYKTLAIETSGRFGAGGIVEQRLARLDSYLSDDRREWLEKTEVYKLKQRLAVRLAWGNRRVTEDKDPRGARWSAARS